VAERVEATDRPFDKLRDPMNRRFGRLGASLGLENSTMETRLRDLPVKERIKLVEDLWDSIARDQSVLPVTPEQKAELDRRLDAFEVDGNRGHPVGEIVAGIRRRL
jgi:putative addiction module component (TIGR02574 family)